MTGNDPMAVERIPTAIAFAVHSADRDFSIERTTKLEAKVFIGTVNIAVAPTWMIKIEMVIDAMGCPDDRKSRLATFLLEKGVFDW